MRTGAETLVKCVGDETLEISIDYGECVYPLLMVEVKTTMNDREWVYTL